VPLVAATLLALAGCTDLSSPGAATNAGKGLAGQGADAAKNAGSAAGQKAQDVAVHDPHLAAAAIVAIIGATFVRWLWRSAQIKYLVFGALVVWITYAVATASH
jgi:hypothetical protein